MNNTMGCVWTSYTFSGNKEKTDGHAIGRTHFTPYIPLRFHINFTSLPLFIVILSVAPHPTCFHHSPQVYISTGPDAL